jgi:hypothetical protein
MTGPVTDAERAEAREWVQGYFPRGASTQSIAMQGYVQGRRAGVAAERERIRQLAVEHGAVYAKEIHTPAATVPPTSNLEVMDVPFDELLETP